MRFQTALPVFLLLTSACASTPSHDATLPPADVDALGSDSIRVVDAAARESDLARLVADVAAADAVFVGETHLDDVTHQVELEILRRLIDRKQGRVVLSLEMFERDVQPFVDRYLAGEIDESEFLAHARPWGNYRTAYRPLVELARERGVPVIAANFPASLRFKVRGKKENWDALTDEDRQWTPRELHPNSAAYWERVDRATRGHGMMSGPPRAAGDRLYDTQCLWDNAMGEAVADAIAAYPGHTVLHVVGGFHVRSRDGSVAQTAVRAPTADLRVVNVIPLVDLAAVVPSEVEDVAGDYAVFTASRASDENEGRWSVQIGGELRYKIRVPKDATDEAPVPLLVWLGDDGERDDDGLRYWRVALGDEAAVVAIDPLHLSEEEDLQLGGRWYWTDTFTGDASRVLRGVERLVDYVTRRFPVDAERVVVAGRGTGATTVLFAAMYTDELTGALVAAEPRKTGRLQMSALPGGKSSIAVLRTITDEAGAEATRKILEDYSKVGIETDLVTVSPNAAGVMAELESSVRANLGLPSSASANAAARPVRLAVESPTARRWAELYVRSATARGAPARLVDRASHGDLLEVGGVWSVADLQKPGVLPTAPGPFGGTTVLVVPAGSDRQAWEELLANDPLAKRSRFLRMRLAYESGGPSLAEVLTELKSNRRKNVLIVPAQFCATGGKMRSIRDSAGEALDGMTAHWLPGLGRRLATTK